MDVVGDKLARQGHFNNGECGMMKHAGLCDHLDTLSQQVHGDALRSLLKCISTCKSL